MSDEAVPADGGEAVDHAGADGAEAAAGAEVGAEAEAEAQGADQMDAEEPDGAQGPLDVLLFAPVGVLMTVAEDLPGLITKGRHRVEQEINNARVVGAFVVRLSQQDVAHRVGRLFGQESPKSPAAPEDVVEATPPPRAPTPTPKPAADPADRAVVEQAFAGYDTLSASQVVRRLESLEPDQLRSVHRYEASHRNRRTILNRTQQLLDSEPPVRPGGPNGSTP